MSDSPIAVARTHTSVRTILAEATPEVWAYPWRGARGLLSAVEAILLENLQSTRKSGGSHAVKRDAIDEVTLLQVISVPALPERLTDSLYRAGYFLWGGAALGTGLAQKKRHTEEPRK